MLTSLLTHLAVSLAALALMWALSVLAMWLVSAQKAASSARSERLPINLPHWARLRKKRAAPSNLSER